MRKWKWKFFNLKNASWTKFEKKEISLTLHRCLITKPKMRNENSFNPKCVINQIWENENVFNPRCLIIKPKMRKWDFFNPRCLIIKPKMRKWEIFNPRFLRSQKIGFFGILYQWKCEEMVMVNCNNDHHFSLNQNNNNPMCVCVCVCFGIPSLSPKDWTTFFFILLNFPPPPRKIRHGY